MRELNEEEISELQLYIDNRMKNSAESLKFLVGDSSDQTFYHAWCITTWEKQFWRNKYLSLVDLHK